MKPEKKQFPPEKNKEIFCLPVESILVEVSSGSWLVLESCWHRKRYHTTYEIHSAFKGKCNYFWLSTYTTTHTHIHKETKLDTRKQKKKTESHDSLLNRSRLLEKVILWSVKQQIHWIWNISPLHCTTKFEGIQWVNSALNPLVSS